MSQPRQHTVATYTPPFPVETAYCLPTERLLRRLDLSRLDELDLTAENFTEGRNLVWAYMNRVFRSILQFVHQYPEDRIHNAIFTGYCFGVNTGLAFHQALWANGTGKILCPEFTAHQLVPRRVFPGESHPRWPGTPSESFTLSRTSPGEVTYSRSFTGVDRSLLCLWRFIPGVSVVVHMHCVECYVPI